jgi:GT2 family glycosyltransferase
MRKNGPDVGLVYVWNTLIDEASNHIGLCTTSRFKGNVFIELLITHFVGCSSTPLIRRECIEKVGGYDTRFFTHRAQGCEDWDLHLRISEHYKFVVVKRLLVGYRQLTNSMSRDHRQMKRSLDLMFNFFRSRHQEIPNRLLAWSNAFYHLYLQKISTKEGDHLHSLIYLLRAAWGLPALVLCGDYRRFYKILAIQTVKYWMPPSLWAMLRRRKHPEKAPEKKSLADLQQHAKRVSQVKQGSTDYLRNRLIEISKKALVLKLETSAPKRFYYKDTRDE